KQLSGKKTTKNLLERINSYRNNAIYESKQGIIKELEQKLAVGNFPEYQAMTVNSVDEFLKAVGIEVSELSPENQNYQENIKRAKTPKEAEQIKDNAINDGGTKKAKKVVVGLLEEAKTADTDEKKSAVRQKIALLKNGNK
ncbi:17101_t:CDS:1, partial [Gigaspora margarita]